jgi:hypothetical protein
MTSNVAFHQIAAESRQLGFDMPSDPLTGAFLRSLAATAQMCAGAGLIVLATMAVHRPAAPRAAVARPAIRPQPGSAA